jgi:hypothetical protein
LAASAVRAQSPTASGSAVVLIRTTNEVLVGTDSKKTYGENIRPSESVCKIHQFGDTFFTQTGLYRYDTNFNVLDLAKQSFQAARIILRQAREV